jgi:Uma2 family endonuclease
MTTFTVKFDSILTINENQFEQICQLNPDVNFEYSSKGKLFIMSPTGGETGRKNSELIADFAVWNRKKKLGVCFDSSTCFKLPSESLRSPDVSWIKNERWQQLTPEERKRFPPIAPDFVLELMSPSDYIQDLKEKMLEYMENGVKLGWLINMKNQQVEIHRQGKEVEILDSPKTLFGEDVLPEFVLDIAWIWD